MTIAQNTAAEPMSFARPESSLGWVPILSTAVSMAELMSSTTMTNIQLLMSRARSMAVLLRSHAAGMAAARMSNSRRSAPSVRNAARSPCIE